MVSCDLMAQQSDNIALEGYSIQHSVAHFAENCYNIYSDSVYVLCTSDYVGINKYVKCVCMCI